MPFELATAQPAANPQDETVLIDRAMAELDAVRFSLTTAVGAAEIEPLRSRAQAVALTAGGAIEGLEPKLATVQATIATLGEPTEGEAADIRDQRTELERERDDLDSAIKRGHLLATNAHETVETVNRSLTDLFNLSTLERTASPLTAAYWQALVANLPEDFGRLNGFSTTRGWESLRRTPSSRRSTPACAANA